MKTDFIVIGSGLAGLTSALVLQDFGKVLIVTKSKLDDCATNLAQGGIAAVVTEEDSFQSHIKDTLVAGCFHNNKKAVEYMVKKAPQAINWLVRQGVRFEKKDGKFSPTREAAHSRRRVLHATDFTGREIERALTLKVKKNKNIKIWEYVFVHKLLVDNKECLGVQIVKSDFCTQGHPELVSGSTKMPKQVRHDKRDEEVINIFGQAVVLATGGFGQLYQWTTNPIVATGDGLALAYRAGARVKDLEFIQFHPTALKDGKSPLFLLSEALRGEGGYLIKLKKQRSKLPHPNPLLIGEGKVRSSIGERFMKKIDPQAELAPRDIVARAIFAEQQKGPPAGGEVYLDIRHKGKEFLQKRFPNIFRKLKRRGLDLSRDLIPVTPVAHYSCGGIQVDLYGRTNIKNLFAFGEVACTGVHGANRLASNSLLESVVFPLRLKECISNPSTSGGSLRNTSPSVSLPSLVKTPGRWPNGLLPGESLSKIRKGLQQLMWEKVGIVRTRKRLLEALDKLREWEREIGKIKNVNKDLIELKNMILVSRLVVQAALSRPKSLGAHFID